MKLKAVSGCGRLLLNGCGELIRLNRAWAIPAMVGALLVSASAVQANPGLTNGLILHYTFDDYDGTNVTDHSLSGNDGRVFGAVQATGVTGEAWYEFDGENDFVRHATGNGVLSGNGPFTLSAWVKTETGGVIMQQRAASGVDGQFILGVATGGSMSFFEYSGVEGLHFFSFRLVGDGEWHHVALVRTATDGCMYVDGMPDACASGAAPSMNPALTFAVACDYRDTRSYLDGPMDDVRVYARALSANEIADLYSAHSVTNTPLLVIAGTPADYGTPGPLGYGRHDVPLGAVVTNTVASVVDAGGGIRQVCQGWLGSGSISPAHGTGATVVATVTQNSGLTWRWRTEYQFQITSGTGGTVDSTGGWYTNGSSVSVEATAADGYFFAGWTGDVPSGYEQVNPLVLAADQPRDVAALFHVDDLTAGLVVHYTFDDYDGINVTDHSLSGNDGRVLGATQTTGLVGEAWYEFDGQNDYIRHASGSGVLSGTTAFTLSAWVKTSAGGVVMQQRDGGGINGQFWFGVNTGGNMSFFEYGGAEGLHFWSSSGVADSEWHHLAFVRTLTNGCMYIDGVLDICAAHPALSMNASRTFAVGCDYRDNSDYFDGSIDDARVYTRALTAADVVALRDATRPSEPITGLVAHYPFNGNANDESGNGHHGTAVGAVLTTDDEGNTNSAYAFDGVSSDINCGDDDGLKVSNGFTICALVYPEGAGGSAQYGGMIVSKEGEYMLYRMPNGTLRYALAVDDPSWIGTDTPVKLPTGQWSHIAASYSSSNSLLRIYHNGLLAHTATATGLVGDSVPTHDELHIGYRQARFTPPNEMVFDGKIDEVRIYNCSLRSGEVAAIYAADGPPEPTAPEPRLVAHYPLNGNANDESGNGYHGTPVGAVLTTDAEGNTNSAYAFDGSSSDINCGDDEGLRMSTGFTVCALVCPHGVGGSVPFGGMIVSKEGEYMLYRMPSGVLRYAMAVDDPYWTATDTPINLPIGQWSHIAWSYSSSNSLVRVYHDGVLAHTATASGLVGDSSPAHDELHIGYRHARFTPPNEMVFDGKIDEVRIYNYGLTPDEVAAVYAMDGNSMASAIHAYGADRFIRGTNTVECVFSYPVDEQLLHLDWVVDLPAGWSLGSAWGDGAPQLQGRVINFQGLPAASPVRFSYSVAVPDDDVIGLEIGGAATYFLDGMTDAPTVTANPDPLTVAPPSRHGADYRDDAWVVDSGELTRVLSYWRDGGYRPDASGDDGYVSTTVPYTPTSGDVRHAADYGRDAWRIDVQEAARVLAYSRAGGYRGAAGGFDGYAPGAAAGARSTSLPTSVSTRGVIATSGGAGYDPGGTVLVTNVVTYEGSLLSLALRPSLPENWHVTAVSGDGNAEVQRDELLWLGALPASPVAVQYTVQSDVSAYGQRTITAEVDAHGAGDVNPVTVSVSPLVLPMDARDGDNDGLPDSWEAHFDPVFSDLDPAADPDRDGADNLSECVAGTDPGDPGSVLRVFRAGVGAGDVALEWASEPDRLYSVMATRSLDIRFTVVASNLVATPPRNRCVVSEGERRFYRIRVENR